jgi:hypothetical protein
MLLVLLVVPQAIQRIDVHHFGFAAVVVYPLAFASGLDLVRQCNDGRARHLGMAPSSCWCRSRPCSPSATH